MQTNLFDFSVATILICIPTDVQIDAIFNGYEENQGRAMRKRVFGHIRAAEARSACTPAQSDRGLYCPLIESSHTTECTTGEQRPG